MEVNIPAMPASNEIRKNFSNPLPAGARFAGAGCSLPEWLQLKYRGVPILILNSTSLGGEQVVLLHDM
jgi:hypothetical protein